MVQKIIFFRLFFFLGEGGLPALVSHHRIVGMYSNRPKCEQNNFVIPKIARGRVKPLLYLKVTEGQAKTSLYLKSAEGRAKTKSFVPKIGRRASKQNIAVPKLFQKAICFWDAEPPKSRFCAYHIERSLYTCAVNHIDICAVSGVVIPTAIR